MYKRQPLFSNYFIKTVEESENRISIKNIKNAEAIIVLSGMLEVNKLGDSTYIEWGDPDRFFGGVTLFNANKASTLVFTGGKIPWEKVKKTEGDILKEFAIKFGIPFEKILVTKEVENTEEESVAVKELITPLKKIILVTSAYHMLRAKGLFEKQGFYVIPYCVDYKTRYSTDITFINLLPNANNLALTEIGFRELLGRLFYKLKN